MGQGMCVSSRLPPGEAEDSSPEEYKPPMTPPRHSGSSARHSGSSSARKKLKRLPVKVRVFLKSPTKASQLDGNPAPTAAEGIAAAAAGTSTRSSRPIPSDVIPGVVQRVQLTHQRSLEKEEELRKNGGSLGADATTSHQATPLNTKEDGRPRNRSFSLRTEKKRVASTSSESDASTTTTPASTSQALSPITHRSTRTMPSDPAAEGLNIIKETTILQDGDESDAPMAQLDELKQFYSFEGVLEIKYTKITRTVTGDIAEPTSPVVPYKYTRTTVTKSRSCSPSLSPRSTSPYPSRPVTPTLSACTQTSIDEEPYTATHSTPTSLHLPRYYSELDSDSDTVLDTTDTGDSSAYSTPDEQSVEYVRLISPDDEDDDEDYEYDEDDEIRDSFQAVNTSYDSIEIPHQYDSARSMSESSSLTSVTMLPSPVSWSVPLREADIAENVLSPTDTVDDMVDLPDIMLDSPISSQDNNIRSAMQDLKLDSDNDSGVDHGEVRSDTSLVVEEQLSRTVQEDLYQPIEVLGEESTLSENGEHPKQQVNTQRHSVPGRPQDLNKPVTKRKDVKKPKDVRKTKHSDSKSAGSVSVRKHVPPFTSDRIPFTTSASTWPFRIRPASMMFQFNRRHIGLGRSGHGNALMMLFGPLIYNPNFPWHDALVTLKVPRHVIKDMNAHLAICSAQERQQQQKLKKKVRILDSGAKDPSIDGDDEEVDDGSDVDSGRNIEALLVVEVQDPEEVERSQKRREEKPSSAKQEHCFTKTPPKQDDKECIIL